MRDVIVDSIVDLTDRIRMFTLVCATGQRLPAFAAGAHIKLNLSSALTRAYSLIPENPESANPENYRIAVQRDDHGNGGSTLLHTYPTGARLQISGPFNSFMLSESAAPATLLAGGIGITPLISMALVLRHRGTPYHMHYAGRSRSTMAFVDVLKAQHRDRLSLYFDDDASARLDLSHVISSDNSHHQLYICGPVSLIDSARALAHKSGYDNSQIHVELFDALTPDNSTASFEVELLQSGEVFTIPADKSIIDVLEEAGIDLVYDCRRGDCGICQTEVIEGEIEHRDVVLSDSERRSGKVMQICVSRAKSARIVLDL